MNKEFELVCTSLDNLSVAIKGGWSGDQTLVETWGWNCPSLTRHDLAEIPANLARRIKFVEPKVTDENVLKMLGDIPKKLQLIQTHTVPQIYGGNCAVASMAFINTLQTITEQLEPFLNWQVSNDPKAMPSKIAKRVRSYIDELDEIAPNKEALSKQIKLIQDAVEAAESLPTDLKALKDAHTKITKISDDSIAILGRISPKEKEATDSVSSIRSKEVEAEKLIQLCEKTYQITTAKGLAGAFEMRATKLSHSMSLWVIGLICALIAGVYLGTHSFDLLSKALLANSPNWQIISINIMMAFFSVGAPVWFAWVATKQIGQKFRLSEDYAFKASVAKAYEGYRKEAARIDPAFEARLFSSALTRLEEAPLRLVESESHGSPWHELFASKPFQRALNTVPELKDKFIEVAKDGMDLIKSTSETVKPKE